MNSPHTNPQPEPGAEVHLLSVNETPPSFNEVGYTGHRWKLTKAVAYWKELMGLCLLAEGVPRGYRHVHARVLLTFPQRRRRDEENFRVVVSKALGDALQERRVIVDDTRKEFSLDLSIADEPGPARTDVQLECTA